jgi:hypothetical protein
MKQKSAAGLEQEEQLYSGKAMAAPTENLIFLSVVAKLYATVIVQYVRVVVVGKLKEYRPMGTKF